MQSNSTRRSLLKHTPGSYRNSRSEEMAVIFPYSPYASILYWSNPISQLTFMNVSTTAVRKYT